MKSFCDDIKERRQLEKHYWKPYILPNWLIKKNNAVNQLDLMLIHLQRRVVLHI